MAEAYRLYAGTQAGMIIFRGVGDIWTSMGGSREFGPYFKGKVVDSVYGCRQSSETVFAGVTLDGLYRTKDAGRHWQRVLEGDIRWVTVDPTDERIIYAGTEPVHLYRSEDGGDSWEELKSLTEMPEEVKYKLLKPALRAIPGRSLARLRCCAAEQREVTSWSYLGAGRSRGTDVPVRIFFFPLFQPVRNV